MNSGSKKSGGDAHGLPGEANPLLHCRRGSEAAKPYTVVRKEEARNVYHAAPVPVRHPGYIRPRPGDGRENLHMRSFLVTLEGEGETERFSSHRGEALILVREGIVKTVLGGDEEVLREGDSIYFPSSIPHRIENLDARRSVILAILYDGRDAP